MKDTFKTSTDRKAKPSGTNRMRYAAAVHKSLRGLRILYGFTLFTVWHLLAGGAEISLQAQPAEPQNINGNTEEKQKTTTVDAPSEGENISIDVEWNKVNGAEKYRLEIRTPGGKLVAEKETADTKATIILPPGEYEKRLGLINKFNKLYLWTDWNPLRIIRVLQPEMELAAPVGPIPRGGGRRTIRLKTEGEMPQTRYYLVDSQGKERSVKTVQNGDEVSIDIDPDSLPPGEYDLVMENPEGKRDVKKDIVVIDRSPTEKAEMRRNNLRYAMLIPGIPQRDRGQKLKGNALMVSFFGSLAFTAYSYQKATSAYNRLQSDPVYGLFKDSTTTAALSNQLASNQAVYLAALAGYDRWQADTSTYNRYRVYYYAGAALTAGLYAYHLVDVYRFDVGMTRTASGEPAISTGLTWNF